MIARVLRSTVFRLLVTAAILAYLVRDVDPGELAAVLLQIDPWWFGAALLLVALDRGVMILRWVLLLRSAGVVLPVKSATWVFLVSSFVGSFLPAGVGGDAARAYAVAARTAQGTEAVASVAIDRILGLVAIVALGAIGLVGWAQHLTTAMRCELTLVSAGVGVLSVATLWTDQIVRVLVPERYHAGRGASRLLRLGDAVGGYRQRRSTLVLVLALSFVVQMTRVLQGYCLGRGMAIDVDLSYYLVFMPIGLLLMLLPISISGFGLPQGVMVWMLEPVGVPHSDAFALSTTIVLLGLLGNLPGAFLYLVRKKPVT